MKDKVQKIREKVVEMVNNINPFIPDEDGKNSDYEAGKLDAATQILQIIDSFEEPVSEDLEDAINVYSEKERLRKAENESRFFSPTDFASGFKAGARWQKARNQETIETAIHHAYHNGRLEMKEQMMTKSIEAVVSQVPCSNEIILYNPSSVYKYSLPQEMNKLGLNKGDKVKVIIIKEE